ncbi:MAG: hypothetical protein COA79_13125 [Planctomycetota bacterium]|nr:MAG: hypothetical protein COA79_13125 [Planctomycetota bacterium]
MVEGRTTKEISSSTSMAAVTVNLKADGEEEVIVPAKNPHPVISAGNTFSHYKIIKKIAHGAMGVVYLARDEKLLRDVALKVILTMPGMVPTDDQTIRFMREAQSVAKLRHPNIVPVFEVDSYEGCQFFAMEYIEGPTLEEFILKEEITASKAIEIIHGILDGLKEAHHKNIVHRDIKPANIIMANNNNPMIMDFGLAKLLENEEKLTMTGSMLGTPCFMSPEQASGDPNLDQRSDIFSVGVLLYEMVIGKLPFKGNSYMKTILLVIEGKYSRPRSIKKKLSKDVENILKKSLEKEKEDRYRCADDMLEDCERFMRGEVVTISKSGMYRKCTRHMWRNKLSIVLSVLTIILIGYLIHVKERSSIESQKELDALKRKSRYETSKVRRDKDKISKEKDMLVSRGEELKLGSTSLQFSEIFDKPENINKRWNTYNKKLKIKNGFVYLPAKNDYILHPIENKFSASLVIMADVLLEKNNPIGIYLGSINQKNNKLINDPILIVYEVEEEIDENYAMGEWTQYIKISFYKKTDGLSIKRKPHKKIIYLSYTAKELATLKLNKPIAIRRFKLPESDDKLITLKVKKNETDIELLIRSKEYEQKFRVSNTSFLTSQNISCGLVVFKENNQEIPVSLFRIDKWVPGGDNSEIGRLLDIGWNDDYQKLFYRFQKHHKPLALALTYATTEDERVSLEYQIAKSLFLMGISSEKRTARIRKLKPHEEIIKLYERSYLITKSYFNRGRNKSTTEYKNYHNLYLSNIYQLSNHHLSKGDLKKSKEFINEYQDQTNNSTPFYDWFWLMPEKLNEYISTHKVEKSFNKNELFTKKLSNIHDALKLFRFPIYEKEKTYFHEYLNELTKSALFADNFELMRKFHDLNGDDSSLKDLQTFILDNTGAKLNGESFVKALVYGSEIYNIPEVSIVNNDIFYSWRVCNKDGAKIRKINHYLNDKLSDPQVQSFFELLPELENYLDPDFNFTLDALNNLNEDELVRTSILSLYQDCILRSPEKLSETVEKVVPLKEKFSEAVGEVFPLDLKIGIVQDGIVHMAFNNDGLKIRLTTQIKKENEHNLWTLFFDFRQGIQFLSPHRGKGRFEIEYNPKAGNKILTINSVENKSIIINENNIDVSVADYMLLRHEISFLIPHDEIFKLIGSNTIKYFAFNATLNLVEKLKVDISFMNGNINKSKIIEKDKYEFKHLFENEKKVLNYELGPFHNVKLPKILDKNFRLVSRIDGKILGNENDDKILFHHLMCHLFDLKYFHPLGPENVVDNAMQNFIHRSKVSSKRLNKIKKFNIFENLKLFFSIKDYPSISAKYKRPMLEAGLEALRIKLKNITIKNTVLKRENALVKEVKNYRSYLFKDNQDEILINEYYNWFDQWIHVINFKNKKVSDEVLESFIELPDTSNNLREKAILYKQAGDLLQFNSNLNKYFKASSTNYVPELLFEYVIAHEFTKKKIPFEDLSPQILNVIDEKFNSNTRNLNVDIFKVLNDMMSHNEFKVKYLKKSGYHDLLDAFFLDRTANGDKKLILKYYKNAMAYFVKQKWLVEIIKKRIQHLNDL